MANDDVNCEKQKSATQQCGDVPPSTLENCRLELAHCANHVEDGMTA